MPVYLPPALERVVLSLRGCFPHPKTFAMFCILLFGQLMAPDAPSICGLWQAAGFAGKRHHASAHYFFAEAVWSLDKLGLCIADMVIAAFVAAGVTLRVAIDGSLFPRFGKNVYGAQYFHDSKAQSGLGGFTFANNFIVAGLVVELPFRSYPLYIPVLFRLLVKDGPKASELADEMVGVMRAHWPGRLLEILMDQGFSGKRWSIETHFWNTHIITPLQPGRHVLWALKSDAQAKGKYGQRLGTPNELAADARFPWVRATVDYAGEPREYELKAIICHWRGVYQTHPCLLVLARELGKERVFALICTESMLSPEEVVSGYSYRWPVEPCFGEAKNVLGVGGARNGWNKNSKRADPKRVECAKRAVQRTVPCRILMQVLITLAYALSGDHEADLKALRAIAPWHKDKRHASLKDILGLLRTQVIVRASGLKIGSDSPPQEPGKAIAHETFRCQ